VLPAGSSKSRALLYSVALIFICRWKSFPTLANRAKFVREIAQAIRARVGKDFHLQMKISATEYNNALLFDEPAGNTVQDSIQVCRWLKDDGVDAIHVSSGSAFPHPRNPAGDFPIEELRKTYESLLSSGTLTLRNYLFFRIQLTADLFKSRWEEARGPKEGIEGINLPDARAIKHALGAVPVICTGGFQTAEIIEEAIERGDCDAVTIARPLIANNDLVQQFERGIGRPARPCTYCNNCLVNAVENPLGCYDESRFPSRDAMVQEILSVFQPAPFE
jgi:2,4-dienoyl-CoA reductase (NADPH2)